MSINNITGATGFIPQFASNPLTGQLFMIAPNQHQLGVSYLWPRSYMEGQTSSLSLPHPIQQRVIPQQTSHQITNQLQVSQTQALPQSPPRRVELVESPFQLKDQTNATIKNIKEKCISHYIEGQLIIETSRPLSELKLKSLKKKDKRKHHGITKQSSNQQPKQQHHHHQQQQPQIQQQQQQQQQPMQSNNNFPSTTRMLVKPEQTQTNQLNPKVDVKSIRAEMPGWSVAEVVNFIEKHEDIKQYSSKFADDEMDGKALLLMIDRNLNLQMLASMFKHGPAMKIEAALSKYKLNE